VDINFLYYCAFSINLVFYFFSVANINPWPEFTKISSQAKIKIKIKYCHTLRGLSGSRGNKKEILSKTN